MPVNSPTDPSTMSDLTTRLDRSIAASEATNDAAARMLAEMAADRKFFAKLRRDQRRSQGAKR
jgi:hypothetical protein